MVNFNILHAGPNLPDPLPNPNPYILPISGLEVGRGSPSRVLVTFFQKTSGRPGSASKTRILHTVLSRPLLALTYGESFTVYYSYGIIL